MSRHQRHLNAIRKMRIIGYVLADSGSVSSTNSLVDLDGNLHECPRCRRSFSFYEEIFRKKVLTFESKTTDAVIAFDTWKELGKWLHDNYLLEVIKNDLDKPKA